MEDIKIKHPALDINLSSIEKDLEEGVFKSYTPTFVKSLIDKIKEQDAEIKALKKHSSIPDFTKEDL